MKTPFKRSIQLMGMCAILGTSACVVDPYYSGVEYGSAYAYDDGDYHSSTVIGTGSNFAFNSGFLVGNYYYLNDYYYPIRYYNNNGNRYYRPIFDRPYRYNPDRRYRNLSPAQLEQWRRNQSVRFDPSYRPNNWPNHRWQNQNNGRWNNQRDNDRSRWNNNRNHDDNRWQQNRRPNRIEQRGNGVPVSNIQSRPNRRNIEQIRPLRPYITPPVQSRPQQPNRVLRPQPSSSSGFKRGEATPNRLEPINSATSRYMEHR